MGIEFGEIDANTSVLITSSNQHAFFLRNKWAAKQDPNECTPSLPIYSLDNLVAETIKEGGECRVLSRYESKLVFEKLCATIDVQHADLAALDLSDKLRDAYKIMRHYEISFSAFEGMLLTPEQEFFAKAMDRYTQYLSEHAFCDHADAYARVVERLANRFNRNGTHLILCGAQEWTPLQITLLNALRDRNVSMTVNAQADNTQLPAISLVNTEAQALELAIVDAQRLVLRNNLVAICVPSLRRYNHGLDFLLSNIKGRNAVSSDIIRYDGVPLCEMNVIQSALSFIAGQIHELPLSTWVSVLKSPYLFSGEMIDAVAPDLESFFYEYGETFLSFEDLYYHARRKFPGLTDALKPHMLNKFQAGTVYPSASAAIQAVKAKLQEACWPGDHLTDIELTAIKLFSQCLDLVSQGIIGARCATLSDALSLIRRVAETKVISPPPKPGAIHVVDTTISGFEWDAVIHVGVSDSTLLREAVNTAFIPLDVLKQYGVPCSSLKESEAQSVSRLTAQYGRANVAHVFSHRVSLAREELELTDVRRYFNVVPASASPAASNDDSSLEVFEGSACHSQFPEFLHGGTYGVKNLMQCQYKGLYSAIFGLKPFSKLEVGLPPRVVGNIIHSTLDHFWQDTVDSKTLASLSDEALLASLRSLLDVAFEKNALIKRSSLNSYLVLNAKLRILNVLHDWLQYEKTLPGFSVIATEVSEVYELQRARIRVRLDRVDKLDDSKQIRLVDYKSSALEGRAWDEHHMTEPQLPLEALFSPFDASVIAACVVNEDRSVKLLSADTPLRETDQGKGWLAQINDVFDRIGDGNFTPNANLSSLQCMACPVKRICPKQEQINE